VTLLEKLSLKYVQIICIYRSFIINSLVRFLFKSPSIHKKILINRDGAFGDAIVSLPALSIIRQNFPEAQIDLLCINNGGITFKNLNLDPSLINNLIVINKKDRGSVFKTLKSENYDLFIQVPQNLTLYKSIRNMLVVHFVLNIDTAFGWDSGRVKSFMSIQHDHLSIKTETERFIKKLREYNLTGERNYPIVEKKPTNTTITDLLERTKPVVFIISGKIQPKKWPLDNWVALANLIGNQYSIIITGGPGEHEEAEHIVNHTTNTINACNLLSIPEEFYVYKKSALAISLDTGALHLCDAAGTKLIDLFSTRELINKWRPQNEKSIVIEKVLPCSFCLKVSCSDNICMKNISPEEVYENFKNLISQE
jgi:lipopolysaccharide heptosyltransferase II